MHKATRTKTPAPAKTRTLAETEAEFFDHNVAYSVMVVANLIARITTQGPLAGEELTLPAWRVLRITEVFGPISAAGIINTLGMDKTTVSRMITYLHDAQLLELTANAADRRQTLVSLTPAGKRLHDRIAALDDQFDRSFESLLTASQMKTFHEVMRTLRAHAQSLLADISAQAGTKTRVAAARAPRAKAKRA